VANATTKYIFVTGGVLSGLGKGITAASIGNILKSRGFSVNIQKLDPYLNPDAGTLNPAEHGEVFVTADGAETDLDLGHYERFLDQELTASSSVMSGKILTELIANERAGRHLGKTVQVVPHFTSAIQDVVQKAAQGFDVHIVEIGGTVGDYESPAFFEAIRSLRYKVGRSNVLNVHVVYLPYLKASKEVKTKPAQNAVRTLRAMGITPDALVARSDYPAPASTVTKLSMFCDVEPEGIVLLPTVDNVYTIPLLLEESGMGKFITQKLFLKDKKPDHTKWQTMLKKALDTTTPTISIGVVAKYMDHEDTYRSVFEAVKAAAWNNKLQAKIVWVDAEALEKADQKETERILGAVDGILVPGGFGTRGLEGKIKAAQYALQKKVPYLGLCLGLQMAVIAAARLSGLNKASTIELEPEGSELVINTMISQKGKENTGGSMRLGNYPCVIKAGSLTAKVYGATKVEERHRHRCECNNAYISSYESWGLKAVGTSPDNNLVEIIEAINHPYFIASQFHPEFKSRPDKPHPLFNGFIKTIKSNLQTKG
jgi:CTP synthase